jgi:4-amino-4-deoxychorismate lyase
VKAIETDVFDKLRELLKKYRAENGTELPFIGGCMGYFSFDGNADFNIVIRTIIKKGDLAYIGVGGGITFESDTEAEYQECLDKAKALLRVLDYRRPSASMVVVNLTPSENELIRLDGGFLCGLGLFETLLVRSGPLFLKEHLDRLNLGLETLELEVRVEPSYVEELVRRFNISDCVLRLTVSEKNIVASTRPVPYFPEDWERGFSIALSELRRNPSSRLTYLKSLAYADNMLERERARHRGRDEAFFLNTRGELAEGSASNLFFVKDSRLHTPSVECGLLAGIIRRWVIERFDVIEGAHPLDELLRADEIFLTNSVMGIMPVSYFEDKAYPIGPVSRRVRAA